jgi:hypothetical protein
MCPALRKRGEVSARGMRLPARGDRKFGQCRAAAACEQLQDLGSLGGGASQTLLGCDIRGSIGSLGLLV